MPSDIEQYGMDKAVSVNEATKRLVAESLENLDTEYIDIVLIHDAEAEPTIIQEIYGALLELKSAGSIKQVGVSNFTRIYLEILPQKPDVVQNPFFPGILCQEILETFCVPGRNTYEYCREENILYQGYKSLGHGKLVDRYGVYDCLKYALQHGVSPVFSSTNVDHIRQVGEAVQTRRLNESPLSEARIDELNLSREEVSRIIYAQ